MLTPVPSQANHSSPSVAVGSRRVRLPKKLHTCFDSSVRVSRHLHTCGAPASVFRNSNDERIDKKTFFVCHCLGAWDWWSGRGHAKAEESFPHNEVDTVLNSQVQQRTVMASGAQSDTEGGMTVAVGSYTTTENRADGDHGPHRPATRVFDSHKKLNQFVSHYSSG